MEVPRRSAEFGGWQFWARWSLGKRAKFKVLTNDAADNLRKFRGGWEKFMLLIEEIEACGVTVSWELGEAFVGVVAQLKWDACVD